MTVDIYDQPPSNNQLCNIRQLARSVHQQDRNEKLHTNFPNLLEVIATHHWKMSRCTCNTWCLDREGCSRADDGSSEEDKGTGDHDWIVYWKYYEQTVRLYAGDDEQGGSKQLLLLGCNLFCLWRGEGEQRGDRQPSSCRWKDFWKCFVNCIHENL